MLVENKKQRCKKKLMILLSFLFIIVFLIFIFPFFILLFLFLAFKIKIFNKSFLIKIVNCLQELFVDENRFKEMLNKRKKVLRAKKIILKRKENNKRLKNELSSSQFSQKDISYVRNDNHNNKDVKSTYSEIIPKKEVNQEPTLSEKHESISSDFWKTKSIWDDYTSVLDNFKK